MIKKIVFLITNKVNLYPLTHRILAKTKYQILLIFRRMLVNSLKKYIWLSVMLAVFVKKSRIWFLVSAKNLPWIIILNLKNRLCPLFLIMTIVNRWVEINQTSERRRSFESKASTDIIKEIKEFKLLIAYLM